MNTTYTSMLCAALAVPALVQPAAAASTAEEFVTTMFELQGAFAEVAEAVVDKKATPEEAAAAITEITAAIAQMMDALAGLPPEAQAGIGDLLENPEIKAAGEQVEAGIVTILKAFIEAEFFGCEALETACAEFCAVNQIEL